jgi:hypothetical protein
MSEEAKATNRSTAKSGKPFLEPDNAAERQEIAEKLKRARLVQHEAGEESTNSQVGPDAADKFPLSPDANAAAEETRVKTGKELRRPRVISSIAAFQYISGLSKDEDVRIRDSDRTTGLLLFLSAALTVTTLFLPQLADHRLLFVIGCDFLVGIMLALYMFNRFGILSTLKPRHALLVWQLIMAAAFIGMFIAVNVGIVIAFYVMSSGIH